MFFGGDDGKHDKTTVNTQEFDGHLMKHTLNMTPMVFCRKERNLGEVKGNVKNPQLWHEKKKITTANQDSEVLMLICSRAVTKIWTHLLLVCNRDFISPWQALRENPNSTVRLSRVYSLSKCICPLIPFGKLAKLLKLSSCLLHRIVPSSSGDWHFFRV